MEAEQLPSPQSEVEGEDIRGTQTVVAHLGEEPLGLRNRQAPSDAAEAAPLPSAAQAHASPDRACQARLRQAEEQYTTETRRSTPTVHATPHCGHEAVTPAFTASVRTFARRIRRQCLERQAASQNTAVVFAVGISGPPHPRHNLGPVSSPATTTSRSRGTLPLPMLPT